jgi:hypothetical protein
MLFLLHNALECLRESSYRYMASTSASHLILLITISKMISAFENYGILSYLLHNGSLRYLFTENVVLSLLNELTNISHIVYINV